MKIVAKGISGNDIELITSDTEIINCFETLLNKEIDYETDFENNKYTSKTKIIKENGKYLLKNTP